MECKTHMGFKMTLAGDQGSGKSTVAAILLDLTKATYYSTGSLYRAVAAKMGMDIADFNLYAETHPETDFEIDNALVTLSEDERDLVIDSRMAWHFVRGNFPVFLFCDMREAASRILHAGRATESFSSLEEALDRVRVRRESEIRRYYDLYKVNIKDPKNYALLLDTTHATPEQVAEKIVYAFQRWQEDSSVVLRFICPTTPLYPDDEADGEEVQRRVAMLERGEEIPPAHIFFEDGVYYLTGNVESALAYALCDIPHMPFMFSEALPSDENLKYVKMENLFSC